jgi:hypothetical protein
MYRCIFTPTMPNGEAAGHFPGGAMLHWTAGAGGKGVVCSADMAIANLDRKSFSFMRSIPNFIPLSEKAVRAVGAALTPLGSIGFTVTTSNG